jgi:hypothetical protein
MNKAAALVCLAVLFLSPAVAVAQHDHHHEAAAVTASSAAAQDAMNHEIDQATDVMVRHSHEDHDRHMGPHMKMSALRPTQAGDAQKADEVVKAARGAMEKYKDPAAAEADGYRLFLPQVKHQKQYHYTSYANAFAAAFNFDPSKPTSLLYADDKDGKKQLIGVMYTAPARFTEDQLNERVPLSVAQWHQHVNLCIPPKDKRAEMLGPDAKFGLLGSIATESECTAAGGTFKPRIFGWMVHAYPNETASDAIWSVERQRPENMAPMDAHAGHQH